jgi:hypothetical protein
MVNENRIKLRLQYSRETDLLFSENIPLYADWLEKKLAGICEHELIRTTKNYKKAWKCVNCRKVFTEKPNQSNY